jgi:hypothetical protein
MYTFALVGDLGPCFIDIPLSFFLIVSIVALGLSIVSMVALLKLKPKYWTETTLPILSVLSFFGSLVIAFVGSRQFDCIEQGVYGNETALWTLLAIGIVCWTVLFRKYWVRLHNHEQKNKQEDGQKKTEATKKTMQSYDTKAYQSTPIEEDQNIRKP